MIKVKSQEWTDFINKLEVIKTKSNREVLCIHCWQMLNCKQKLKHLKRNPDHEKFLLTSTKYASEKQILSLAQAQNKFYRMQDGEYIMPPYGPLNRVNKINAPNSLLLGDQYIKTLLSNDNLFSQNPDMGMVGGQGMGHQETLSAFAQMNQNAAQPSMLMQHDSALVHHQQQSSIEDKIQVINQKLDSVIKVLQMLIQQDVIITQTLNQVNQNFQNFVQAQIINKQPSIFAAQQHSLHLPLSQGLQSNQFGQQQILGGGLSSGTQQQLHSGNNPASSTHQASNQLFSSLPSNNIQSQANSVSPSIGQNFSNNQFGIDKNIGGQSSQIQDSSSVPIQEKNFINKSTLNTSTLNNVVGSQSLGGQALSNNGETTNALGNQYQIQQNQYLQHLGQLQHQQQFGLQQNTNNNNNQSAQINNNSSAININQIQNQNNYTSGISANNQIISGSGLNTNQIFNKFLQSPQFNNSAGGVAGSSANLNANMAQSQHQPNQGTANEGQQKDISNTYQQTQIGNTTQNLEDKLVIHSQAQQMPGFGNANKQPTSMFGAPQNIGSLFGGNNQNLFNVPQSVQNTQPLNNNDQSSISNKIACSSSSDLSHPGGASLNNSAQRAMNQIHQSHNQMDEGMIGVSSTTAGDMQSSSHTQVKLESFQQMMGRQTSLNQQSSQNQGSFGGSQNQFQQPNQIQQQQLPGIGGNIFGMQNLLNQQQQQSLINNQSAPQLYSGTSSSNQGQSMIPQSKM